MMPREHLIASLIMAAVFYPFFGISSLLVIAGGFLIDADHYLFYAIKFRDLSIKKAYDYHTDIKPISKSQKQKLNPYVFHTAEFMLLLLFLSFKSTLFLIFLAGVVLHVILDIIDDRTHPKKEAGRAPSLLIWLLKRDLGKAGF